MFVEVCACTESKLSIEAPGVSPNRVHHLAGFADRLVMHYCIAQFKTMHVDSIFDTFMLLACSAGPSWNQLEPLQCMQYTFSRAAY